MNGFKKVVSGVYMAEGNPSEILTGDNSQMALVPRLSYLRAAEVSGMFFTAKEFGRAGIDSGQSKKYGHRVMRNIALQMVALESDEGFSTNDKGYFILNGSKDYDVVNDISMIMNNTEFTERGSQHRLLLESTIVFKIWRSNQGRQHGSEIPRLDTLGHQVVSMAMLFRPDVVESLLSSESEE